MTDFLGRGLESLIPQKEETPPEAEPLDVLHHQAGMHEPVYRFHDDAVLASRAAAVVPQANAAAASAQASGPPSPGLRRAGPPSQDLPARQAGLPLSASPRPSSRRITDSIFWIEVSKIEPNPHQPRRGFNVEELTSLADSIKEVGVLSPLLVTKREIETTGGLDVRYQLIAGERRWRAAKLAGLREVPVIVRLADTPEREKLELALIENVQREDLNPIERSRAFDKLVGEFGLMQKEVAERIGKSREVVANALRLLRLPPEMQEAILSHSISESHARVLLTLEHDPTAQRRVFEEIRTAGLSVRDAEVSARAAGANTAIRRGRPRLDPDSRAILRELEEVFGTKVKLSKRGEHGRIIVEFYSDEELRGILDRISKREEGYV